MFALPKSSALGQSTKSLPRNTVLLIGSNLWARLSPSEGNLISYYMSKALLGQKMTIETAMVTGLLALDGTPDGVA